MTTQEQLCLRKHKYIRQSQHDKRIGRGDDHAADAYLDNVTGQLVYVVVGHDPNTKVEEPSARCGE